MSPTRQFIQLRPVAPRPASAYGFDDLHKMNKAKLVWIPQAIASVMLLVALNPDNPYGYYTLLRWVVCGIFAYLAFVALEKEKTEWVWTLGIVAAVYNPFIKMHLGRELWSVVNLVTIVIGVASIAKLKGKENE